MTKSEIIINRLTELFRRFSVPDNLKADQQAQVAEFASFEKAIADRAPDDGVEIWMGEFAEALILSRRTRIWPVVADLVVIADRVNLARREKLAAEAAARSPSGLATDGDAKEQYLQNLVAKFSRGAGVPEGALYGPTADELLSRGMVSGETLRVYRAAAYQGRVKAYSRQAADAWVDMVSGEAARRAAEKKKQDAIERARDMTPESGGAE